MILALLGIMLIITVKPDYCVRIHATIPYFIIIPSMIMDGQDYQMDCANKFNNLNFIH